jgi:hypothetical protein
LWSDIGPLSLADCAEYGRDRSAANMVITKQGSK